MGGAYFLDKFQAGGAYSGGAYKKSVYFNQHRKKILNFHYAWLKYRSRNARVEVKLKFNHTEIAFELWDFDEKNAAALRRGYFLPPILYQVVLRW